jgi:hypothetical protein
MGEPPRCVGVEYVTRPSDGNETRIWYRAGQNLGIARTNSERVTTAQGR